MQRRAFLIGGNYKEPENLLAGVGTDISAWKSYLMSSCGGSWTDDEIVAKGHIEIASPFEHLGIIRPGLCVETIGERIHVCTARHKSSSHQHATDVPGPESVIAGELNATVADGGNIIKGLLQSDPRDDNLPGLILRAADVSVE